MGSRYGKEVRDHPPGRYMWTGSVEVRPLSAGQKLNVLRRASMVLRFEVRVPVWLFAVILLSTVVQVGVFVLFILPKAWA